MEQLRVDSPDCSNGGYWAGGGSPDEDNDGTAALVNPLVHFYFLYHMFSFVIISGRWHWKDIVCSKAFRASPRRTRRRGGVPR